MDDGVGVLLTQVALESIREKLDESEGGVTETEDVREYLEFKKSEISVSFVKLYLLAHEEDVDWNTVAWTSSFSPAPVDLPAVSAGESRLRYSRPTPPEAVFIWYRGVGCPGSPPFHSGLLPTRPRRTFCFKISACPFCRTAR